MSLIGSKVRDKRLLRLIAEYLRAPLQKPDGSLAKRTQGTPQGGPLTPCTHLVTSSFPPDCLCFGETGIWALDFMTQMVLRLRLIEASLCRATLLACEPSPAIAAARTSSGGGSASSGSCPQHLGASGASLCATRPGSVGTAACPGRKGGVYREASPQPDPVCAAERTAGWRRDQCVGGRSVAAGRARRFRPWVKCSTRGDSTCGSKPWEIVWLEKKSSVPTDCSCPRRRAQ